MYKIVKDYGYTILCSLTAIAYLFLLLGYIDLANAKSDVKELRKTNCGIRLAMIQAAEGAEASGATDRAMNYRDIADLWPASQCDGVKVEVRDVFTPRGGP
jgi:hypothetical protein